MADARAERISPAVGLPLPFGADTVRVADAGPAARFSCRGTAAALAEVFGLTFPEQPCRVETGGGRAVLWLGPDEWLIIAPAADGPVLATSAGALTRSGRGAAVDVSHRNAALLVTGRRAAALINAGCPLDLDTAAFPVGMAARTLLAKAEIVLWRTAPDAFRIEVWRSFLPYVTASLSEAVRDLDT